MNQVISKKKKSLSLAHFLTHGRSEQFSKVDTNLYAHECLIFIKQSDFKIRSNEIRFGWQIKHFKYCEIAVRLKIRMLL